MEMVDTTSSHTKNVPRDLGKCSTDLIRKEEDDHKREVVDFGDMLEELKSSRVSIEEFGSRLDAIKKQLL